MINVSKEFRETMKVRRDFKEYATITFTSGESKTLDSKDFTVSNQSFTDGAGSSSFPLGAAIEKSIQIEIMNDKEQYSEYDFFGAKIEISLKLQLSETIESINKGTYTVVTPETYGTVISIVAVDDMYKADREYDSSLVYPATAGEVLRDACSKCGIYLLTTTFENSTKEILNRPENVTYRQVIGFCAMFAAGNARLDVNNRLSIIPYDFSYFDNHTILDGGIFDANTPYATGDDADGGTFKPWNDGDSYDGGEFGDRENIHILYSFKNLTVDTDDIVVTGIQTTIEETEEIYISGNEGYMFSIENPLFSGIEKEMTDYLGSRLIGIKFRKFSGDHISDPTIEAYDLAYIIDSKSNVYQTIITDVNFNVLGWTNLSNSAESTIRNSSDYFSNASEAIVAARKETKKQISEYDMAVQMLTSLITQSFGVFKTEETLEDGSAIYYLHDKPTLEESKTIWKMTSDAFAVSTDGGKTWNAGMDSEGNAVVNVLSAIGIQFDWAKGGTLTLGGYSNQYGILRILDEDGNQKGIINRSGVHLYGGDNTDPSFRITSDSGEALLSFDYLNLKHVSNSVILDANDPSITLRNSNLNRYVNLDGSVNSIYGSLTVNGNVSVTGRMDVSEGFSTLTSVIVDCNSLNTDYVDCSGGASFDGYTFINDTLSVEGIYCTGSLTVTGNKNRLLKTNDYGERVQYAYETAYPMFGDVGRGRIEDDGKCYIFLEDIFLETVDIECEYNVFLQKYGKGDVWVEEIKKYYFVIKGTPGLEFSWEIKARQKDYSSHRLFTHDTNTIKVKNMDYGKEALKHVKDVSNCSRILNDSYVLDLRRSQERMILL